MTQRLQEPEQPSCRFLGATTYFYEQKILAAGAYLLSTVQYSVHCTYTGASFPVWPWYLPEVSDNFELTTDAMPIYGDNDDGFTGTAASRSW